MSGHDYNPYIDDYLEEEEEEREKKPVIPPADILDPKTESANKVTRSRADDVIDAVEGIERKVRKTACPKCRSDNIDKRVPLGGGVATNVCRKCRTRWPAHMAGAVTTKPPKPRQSTRGPFYSSNPKPKPDKNQPPNRIASELTKK